MITMQGFLILLGTVVNNPIMMSTTTTIFGLSPLALILLTHKMLISVINRSVELQLQLTRFLLHFECLITHFICEPARSKGRVTCGVRFAER
ncbi:MAG: hypothetical protein ACI9LX_004318 [Paraglaciecola sp.]|jgi:hypothetical protein